MSFESFDLHPLIKKSIAAIGFTTPTPVQEKAIPVVLEGRDVVACAQTGTGKTAAFVLPALNLIANADTGADAPKKHQKRTPRILVLTPTRELATQITAAARQYGRQMQFNLASLVGGMSYYLQEKDLHRGADMIIATPGRLIDHLEKGRVDLSHIEMLILDEADRMLDMGFIDDVKLIAAETPAERQTLLFSATLDSALNNIIKELLRDPERFDLSQEQLTAPKIKQTLYKAKHMHDKTRLLKQLLDDSGIYKAIIFTATKVSADNIADELCASGYASAPLHGDLRQSVRTRTLESLRRGKVQYLVATDVAARGIDISDITHVINFDLPRQSEDYVHRIGRTGRAGKDGEAISFVTNADVQHIQRIERYLGQRLRLVQLLEGTTEIQEISPARPFVKSDDTKLEKTTYGYGKKRENDRSRSSGGRFDKPFKKREFGDSRGGDRDAKPRSFRAADRNSEARPFRERSEHPSGEARPFRERSERPSGEARPFRERSERPSGEARPFRERSERPSGEARPFRERSDAKPFQKRERSSSSEGRSFRSIERSSNEGRSFRPASSDAKPFNRGEGRERSSSMNPFAKPEKRSYQNDDSDRAPRREKTAGGFQPMKKAGFRAKPSNEAKPFQKRERKKFEERA